MVYRMRDDKKGDKMDHKESRWQARKEMLEAMDEKELRAFILGYMMGQKLILKKMVQMNSSSCESGGCNCGGGSCGCGGSCNCENEPQEHEHPHEHMH